MSSGSVARRGAQRPRLWSLPAARAGSAGPDAVEFAESLGYRLDDWQEWVLDGLFSEDSKQRLCASLVLLILPRQNGKNVVLEVAELFAFYVLEWPVILHTAHRAETAADHMARLRSVLKENPDLEAITEVYEANGKERLLRTDTRAELRFVTRSRKIGRGRSPRMVVVDEALFIDDDQLQALLPSMSAQSMGDDAPLMIYASSGPLPTSHVLKRLRDACIAGMPSAFFAEWSCRRPVDPADRDRWYEANPGLGVRISEDWVAEKELALLSVEAFLVERLGVVDSDDGSGGVLPGWSQLVDDRSQCVDPVVFAVDVPPDRSMAAIGVAGRRSDGLDHLELVEHLAGTAWVVERLVALSAGCESFGVVVDPASPAGSLIAAMTAAGLTVIETSARDMAQACGQIADATADRCLRWRSDPAITAAVDGATTRLLGDAWAWNRKTSASDISPLVALTLARWGLHRPRELVGAPAVFSLDDY